jgi:hypothetical protein
MKSTVTLIFLAFILLASARTPAATPDMEDYADIVANVVSQVKAEVPDFVMPAMNFTNITTILIGELGGFLSGIFSSANQTDTIKCFDNFQNVTNVYHYIMKIVNGGLEKETFKLIRQVLVLGVMMLNVTIEEWSYCQNVTYIWYTFYGTFRCMINCPRYYMAQLSKNLLYNTFYYIYYLKEAYREFANTNYHLSGNWLGYAFNNVLLLANQPCYYTCPSWNTTIEETDSRIAIENTLV